MEAWEAVVAVIVAVLGSGGIVVTYLKHRLDKEQNKSRQLHELEQEKRRNLQNVENEIDLAKSKEWAALGVLLEAIVDCLHGERPNGQLTAARKQYSEAVNELEMLYKKKRIFLDSEQ